jgi:flagellar biosynthesis protein FlhF
MGAAAYAKVQAVPASGDLGRELGLLKEMVGERFSELRNLLMDLAHRQSLSEKWRDRPDLVGLYRSLLATGLDPDRSRQFVEKAAEGLEAWGGDLGDHLRSAVRPLLRCLSPETPLPRLVAVVGPSGSGKTTTLVRLAAFCQRRGQRVSAITLDTLKLGAAEQLGQYARIMGLGLKACQNKAQFEEALEIFEASDVVLVDTNPRDFGRSGGHDELTGAVSAAGAKLLLVLPAGLKTADLAWFHERLTGPELLGLVLTKLDESRGLGNVMSFLASGGAPLAFLSTGPRTPEDFQAAKADRLLDYWLGAAPDGGTDRTAP